MMKRLLLALLVMSGAAGSECAANAQAGDQKLDAAKECASYGLKPDTEGYKACVSALADQDNDPSMSQMRSNMDRQRAEMRADMERQNADMMKQMDADMQSAQHPANGAPSKCVTTVNGTNTSTVCP
jgi:roadblock/LC7 domain-containing protein